MRALIAESPGRLVLDEVPVPPCPSDGLLVRNHVTAVSSGTEQLMLHGRGGVEDAKHPGWPQVGGFGYLGAGEVTEVGRDVRGLSPGDRVACGRVWGMHREVVDVPAHSALHLPDAVGFRDGACSYWAVPPMAGIIAARPRPGELAAVLGLGPLGLAAVELLIAAGHSVLAIDPIGHRRELAAGRGAVPLTPAEARGRSERGDDLPAVLLEVSGSQAGLELALELAAPLARVVLVGVLPPLDDVDLHWPMQVKGVKILPIARPSAASPEGGGPGSPRNAYLPTVLRWLADGHLDLAGACTWVVPPDRAPHAFELLHQAPERLTGLAIAWEGSCTAIDGFEENLRAHRSSRRSATVGDVARSHERPPVGHPGS